MKARTLVALLVLLALASSCTRPNNRESGVASAPTPSVMTPSQTRAQVVEVSQPVSISPSNTDAAEPAVAAGRDGTVFVAWVEHRPNRQADVWLAHLDGEGKSLGPPARVNPNGGEATAWHGDPPTICVADNGTVYVGWTARAASKGKTTLYLSASHDDGKTFAAPSKINDDHQPAAHGMHSLAVAPAGRVYVAWLDERNVAPPPPSQHKPGEPHVESNSEVFFSYSTDGGKTFSPNQRIASDVCPCCKTSLATAPDGRVYLSWRQVLPGDFRHIAVSSSNDGGQTFSAPVIVSDDRWVIAGCPVSGASLVVGTDGVLRVLWYSGGQAGTPGLYWSESRDGARTFTPRNPLAKATGRGAPILLENTNRTLTAIWEDTADHSSTRIATAQLIAQEETPRSTDNEPTPTVTPIPGTGELPAATRAARQIFVAYVSNSGDRRAILLARAKLPDA